MIGNAIAVEKVKNLAKASYRKAAVRKMNPDPKKTRLVDQENWPRKAQFELFRTYERPHFAVTKRMTVHNLLTEQKAAGVSPYRACLFAIGAGLHAVEELRMRFRGKDVVCHGAIELSMTVPKQDGSFAYGYVPYFTDFLEFDLKSKSLIRQAAEGELAPNMGERDDLAYLSCMPWLDYTSINNALPHANDCIPRVSWGKFVQDSDGIWRMAMTLEVHHALVDGEHVGAFFEKVQSALDSLSA